MGSRLPSASVCVLLSSIPSANILAINLSTQQGTWPGILPGILLGCYLRPDDELAALPLKSIYFD